MIDASLEWSDRSRSKCRATVMEEADRGCLGADRIDPSREVMDCARMRFSLGQGRLCYA